MRKQENHTFTIILVSFWVFLATLFILTNLGLVPYYIDGERPPSTVVDDTTSRSGDNPKEDLTDFDNQLNSFFGSELDRTTLGPVTRVEEVIKIVKPERLVIHSLNKDVPITNPASADIHTLENNLYSSVVRYPQSATLEEKGNVFIFGHSSYLKTVHNKMYQAFNGIQNLHDGDTIKLIGGGKEYIYRVFSVYKANAKNDKIKLTNNKQMLTLATCNVFAEKTDRWIVEAELIGSYVADKLE